MNGETMSGGQALVGAIVVIMIIGLALGLAFIMTRQVDDDDLDDDF